ncbi:MAG: sigma-54 dependent transcriptional regulator [Bacteroidales bacterium]|nr:sigma-54 dependent transcriptional regulator [Bacteroidales bacterium]MCF8404539.1 sigma-54 dependent transcriptional regulator [Bacteroidales bacterium]
MNNQNVLVLDDEAGFREELSEFLNTEGYSVETAGLPSEALCILEKTKIDIGLFDVRLPETDGISLLSTVKKKYPYLEIIIMTGFGDMPTVIKAMRSGAADFLNKPFNFKEIKTTIDRISKYQRVRNAFKLNDDFGQWLEASNNGIIGSSETMLKVFDLIKKVAKAKDATVLITGESGTGKELIARLIHTLSDRNMNPFVAVNCSTIPDELFESEFFGHMKGSFTDAKTDRQGIFEASDKGTLFLDEISEMKAGLQAKLLRVIEDKTISPLGSRTEKKVDVRIFAASNQNLPALVENNQFRSDLYHRLNLFNIEIPPLRERKDDIHDLVHYFVDMYSTKLEKKISRIESRVIRKLQKYHFPGNVRELKNIVERAVILCDQEVLSMDYFDNLSILIDEFNYADVSVGNSLSLPDLERECIQKALNKAKNNKTKAASLLNISRQALDRKLSKYRIEI